MRRVRVGCSGWNYKHWRRWRVLSAAVAAEGVADARCFDTVEVNATFYRLPRETAVARWVGLTRSDFVFAVKMSRYVTHVKRLRDLDESEPLYDARIAPLIGDDPRRPFRSHELTTDFTFVRFHSGRRGRNGNYSEAELDEWAERIRGWRERVGVFAYFNNDPEGFGVRNALGLKERLGQ